MSLGPGFAFQLTPERRERSLALTVAHSFVAGWVEVRSATGEVVVSVSAGSNTRLRSGERLLVGGTHVLVRLAEKTGSASGWWHPVAVGGARVGTDDEGGGSGVEFGADGGDGGDGGGGD